MSEAEQSRWRVWVWEHRWHLLMVWIVVFSGIVGLQARDSRMQTHKLQEQTKQLQIANARLIKQNREIQESRLSSCQHTYKAFPEVFKPFFRPPKQQTAHEKSDQLKFKRVVNKLAANCVIQTKPGTTP